MNLSVAVMEHIVVEHEEMDVSPYREEVSEPQPSRSSLPLPHEFRETEPTDLSQRGPLTVRMREVKSMYLSDERVSSKWMFQQFRDVPLESLAGSSLRKLLAVSDAHNRAICSCFHREKLHPQTCIALKGYFNLQTNLLINYCECPTKSMRKSFSLPKISGRHLMNCEPNCGLDEEFL